jgi:hypothetical protein
LEISYSFSEIFWHHEYLRTLAQFNFIPMTHLSPQDIEQIADRVEIVLVQRKRSAAERQRLARAAEAESGAQECRQCCDAMQPCVRYTFVVSLILTIYAWLAAMSLKGGRLTGVPFLNLLPPWLLFVFATFGPIVSVVSGIFVVGVTCGKAQLHPPPSDTIKPV